MKFTTKHILFYLFFIFIAYWIQYAFSFEEDEYILLGISNPKLSYERRFNGQPWGIRHPNETWYEYGNMWLEFIKILAGQSLDKSKVRNARDFDLPFESSGFTVVNITNYGIQKGEPDWIEKLVSKVFPEYQVLYYDQPVYRGYDSNSPLHLFHFDYDQSLPDTTILGTFNLSKVQNLQDFRFLGFWTPWEMNSPVCLDSLVLLDASTKREEDTLIVQSSFYFETRNGTLDSYDASVGGLYYNKDQRWYYYDGMVDEEVLIFSHYTHGRPLYNIHGSLNPKHCNVSGAPRKALTSAIVISAK